MTVHLLRGAGTYGGSPGWAHRQRAVVPLVNRPATLGTACGAQRPALDVTDQEAKVTCGSCRRADEYGDNYPRRVARARERQRQAALRTAARNRALRLLTDAHPDEWRQLYEAEHVLLVLAHPREFPPDEGLPPVPRP